MKRLWPPTPATVIACLALFVALGGSAYAVTANSVGSKQLKRNAVTAPKIKKNAVTAPKIRGGAVTAAKIKTNAVTTAKLLDDAVTGAKVREDTLGTVPSADALTALQTNKLIVSANSGANESDARAASAKQNLLTVGPVTIYGRCFTDASGPDTSAEVFIETTENGVVFDSHYDQARGNPFLNANTPEDDRDLLNVDASADDSGVYANNEGGGSAILPNGEAFQFQVGVAVKNGTLPGGNGVFGEGDRCIFSASALSL